MSGKENGSGSSGRTYLDSVSAVFEQNHKERQNRIQAQRVRNEVAKAHSQYLQQNVVSPVEFQAAQSTVAAWANKHDVVGRGLKTDIKRLHQRGHTLSHLTSAHTVTTHGRRRSSGAPLSQTRTEQSQSRSATFTANHSAREAKFDPFSDVQVQDLSVGSNATSATSETIDFVDLDCESKCFSDPNGNTLSSSSGCCSTDTINQWRFDTSECSSPEDNGNESILSACSVTGMSAVSWPRSISANNINNTSTMNVSNLNLSDDSDDGEVVYLSDEESEDGPLSCSVVNCWAVFSCKEYLVSHLECSQHSPCNPVATLIDGQLVSPPQFYMCPTCGHLCQECLTCQEHMVMCDHMPLMFPLPVVAFACPQCLALFPDQITCDDHISSQKHLQFAMPFKGDKNDAACPVPIPQAFAEEFIKCSKEEPSTVHCIDCDVDISAEDKWQEHQRSFGNQHTSIAHAKASHMDILLKFLSDKACDTCCQVLYMSPGASGCHDCAEGVTGMAEDMNIDTFAEFIRHCSISSPRIVEYPAPTSDSGE